MFSILFICTANRFRSPLAAGYFACELVNRHYRDEILISSAGTWAENGLPVMPSALECARSIGLNLDAHKSRMVNYDLLNNANLILVMTSNHKEAISLEFPDVRNRVFLLSEAAGFSSFDILDPFAGDNVTVEMVAKEIVDIINQGFYSILTLIKTTYDL